MSKVKLTVKIDSDVARRFDAYVVFHRMDSALLLSRIWSEHRAPAPESQVTFVRRTYEISQAQADEIAEDAKARRRSEGSLLEDAIRLWLDGIDREIAERQYAESERAIEAADGIEETAASNVETGPTTPIEASESTDRHQGGFACHCGHRWYARKTGRPAQCPRCKDYDWYKPRSKCAQCSYICARVEGAAYCPRCRAADWEGETFTCSACQKSKYERKENARIGICQPCADALQRERLGLRPDEPLPVAAVDNSKEPS